jgi:hypothetical protein
MPSRRALILTAAGLAGSAAFGSARAAGPLTVIYVGGWDCPPCIDWKKNHKAGWLASPEYGKVTWIEVEAPKLKEAYQERYWPGDLKPILDQLPRKTGTPRFLIVRDGRVIANEFGGRQWAKIVDELKKLL